MQRDEILVLTIADNNCMQNVRTVTINASHLLLQCWSISYIMAADQVNDTTVTPAGYTPYTIPLVSWGQTAILPPLFHYDFIGQQNRVW